MRKKVQRYVALCVALLCSVAVFGQEEEVVAEMTAIDSVKAVSDSIMQELRNQVQELKLQGIMMQEQLERTGRSAREDSLRQVERKARVDSLRSVTQGAPLIVEGDTLLVIYARKGGLLPEARVTAARIKIIEVGKTLALFPDSIYVFDSEVSTDVMAGDNVILSVTDLDALWNNCDRQELAQQYSNIIGQKVAELHATYGIQQKMQGMGLVVLIIVAQVFLIMGTNWLFRRWKFRVTRKLLKIIKPINIKDYALLDQHRLGIAIIVAFNLLRLFVILLQLLVTIPLLFSVFPETKTFTYAIFGYIWHPVRDIFSSVIDYLPTLFKIVVIILCFRYLLKGVRYFANEISSGKLKINGFYADWAMPTYTILRVLFYSFMFVMIWPLLPSSDSSIFQGVSVFIGVIVSLGSTSIVGNVMAGLVMTYMRPFHIGDFVRFGDTEGEVVEKTMLVTRIRTRKNELVTIPNSNLLGAQTSNFTSSAHRFGIIVHTKITIGYDEPWKKIERLLLEAADATDGIKKHPKPYVRVTALDDFYVEYEINGYTERSKTLPGVYSTLHQNILDHFHGAGVEIMSPHISARRDNLPPQIPPTEV
ncbi:MAG: mechanosensitive ion channel family protein [Bacteroidaceae bacterium]|nr:mechanosensitive ion channel family protein [Bacteroidaceae bacterium]